MPQDVSNPSEFSLLYNALKSSCFPPLFAYADDIARQSYWLILFLRPAGDLTRR